MEKREIEHYRRQVASAHDADAKRRDGRHRTDARRERRAVGRVLSNAPMHLGDMGTDEYLQDLNATLLEHEEFLSNEVREAFDRIENGTFGRCENCGKPIPKERLDAIPYARWCAPCAEAADKGSPVNFNAGRPQRPRDTLAPQGEMDEAAGAEHGITTSRPIRNRLFRRGTSTPPALRAVGPRSEVWPAAMRGMAIPTWRTCKTRWAAASRTPGKLTPTVTGRQNQAARRGCGRHAGQQPQSDRTIAPLTAVRQ